MWSTACGIPACNALCFLLPSRAAYVSVEFVQFCRKNRVNSVVTLDNCS